MRTRSLAPSLLFAILGLSACAGDAGGAEVASSGASSSGEGGYELSDGDVETCTEFVAGEDRVVEFLTTVEATGSIYDDPDGQAPLATLADRAQPYLDVAEHADLVLPLERLVTLDGEARQAIVSGQLDPGPHLNALRYAATLCEYGGTDIDWHG
ncbi:hypothetical protein [Blastococcus sp. SYSU D00813]